MSEKTAMSETCSHEQKNSHERMNNIQLIQGDITAAHTDAIVNAANPAMLGGGGVDGAIHAAAGPELLEACYAVQDTNGIRCPIGEARITSAGKLNARHVIHTVGPRYTIDPNPAALLACAYRNTLRLALKHNCKSVALPAISCGVYGYPFSEAANIAIGEASQSEFEALQMTFYLFGVEITNCFATALAQRSSE